MNYQLIIIPIAAALITQLIKMIINGIKGKFSWKDMNRYGGMPSSHTATVVSLAASVGYFEGWNSAAFAVALMFALVVIRDAGGFRRILSNHAVELNQLVHSMNPTEKSQYPHLVERLGHTPLELFFGAIAGLVITVLYILLFA